jgi:hypothetical protein
MLAGLHHHTETAEELKYREEHLSPEELAELFIGDRHPDYKHSEFKKSPLEKLKQREADGEVTSMKVGGSVRSWTEPFCDSTAESGKEGKVRDSGNMLGM